MGYIDQDHCWDSPPGGLAKPVSSLSSGRTQSAIPYGVCGWGSASRARSRSVPATHEVPCTRTVEQSSCHRHLPRNQEEPHLVSTADRLAGRMREAGQGPEGHGCRRERTRPPPPCPGDFFFQGRERVLEEYKLRGKQRYTRFSSRRQRGGATASVGVHWNRKATQWRAKTSQGGGPETRVTQERHLTCGANAWRWAPILSQASQHMGGGSREAARFMANLSASTGLPPRRELARARGKPPKSQREFAQEGPSAAPHPRGRCIHSRC